MSELKIISKKEFLKENKKPNQEKVWNSIAIPWKTYVVKAIPIVEEFLKTKKGKVVDFGCGTGRNMIPNKEINYYGIDFSENQLKYAREYAKKNKINSNFFKSKLDNLNKQTFEDNTFDYGLFIGSLHCLETERERLRGLKEFYRVLKPNAQALISVWNSEDKRFARVNNHGDIYMSWREKRIPYMRHYYLFEKEELLSLIKSIGFKVLDFYKPKEHDRFSKKNLVIKIGK